LDNEFKERKKRVRKKDKLRLRFSSSTQMGFVHRTEEVY